MSGKLQTRSSLTFHNSEWANERTKRRHARKSMGGKDRRLSDPAYLLALASRQPPRRAGFEPPRTHGRTETCNRVASPGGRRTRDRGGMARKGICVLVLGGLSSRRSLFPSPFLLPGCRCRRRPRRRRSHRRFPLQLGSRSRRRGGKLLSFVVRRFFVPSLGHYSLSFPCWTRESTATFRAASVKKRHTNIFYFYRQLICKACGVFSL